MFTVRKIALACTLFALAAASACGKGPAEAALTAAETSVNSLGADAAKFVPEQVAGVQAALADARKQFDAGDYAAALASAQALPGKVSEVAQAAAAKKTELTNQWTQLQGSLPGILEQIQAKVAEFSAMKRLPKDMDAATLDSAKAGLESLNGDWTSAMSAFQSGSIVEALGQATQLKSKAESLLAQLSPPAAQ